MAENNSNNNQGRPQSTSQPGLISSHYQYAKGAAEATVGVLTNSQAWKASGEQDKAAGLAALKRVGEQRSEHPEQGYGKVEQMAGKIVGCEGMMREGDASIKNKNK
ncbi:hypothetical protein B0J13DRAFT_562881 [Dactylonectria estremocensis]|uniref:CsbD-like domain-containing protein n=1 Tax=Dactylonectria estremocensis TaxID=1079267 RepID=A0A9P9IUJ0_9HYPO|nr:hypothetical protein B0J13DRAFT_562881 [Dactylonectria estremocensis]